MDFVIPFTEKRMKLRSGVAKQVSKDVEHAAALTRRTGINNLAVIFLFLHFTRGILEDKIVERHVKAIIEFSMVS